MLAASRARVLVTGGGLPGGLDSAPDGVPVVDLADPGTAAEIAAAPAGPLRFPAGGQLAYVIFTSGSTGAPKGVAVTHRGLANYVTWAAAAYRVGGGPGAPLHGSLAFDLTVTSVLVPLAAGATVVISAEGGPQGLAGLLRQGWGFSLVKVVPAHLPLLAALVPATVLAAATWRLVVGGEPLAADDVRSWLERSPQSVVVNEYGPTETVVGCTAFEITAGQQLPGTVPIGTPIASTRLYVLDRHLGPVPSGVTGELYIAGAQLARGYLHQPVPNGHATKRSGPADSGCTGPGTWPAGPPAGS
jgi:non-ribosomal peptide synthetase component F